MSRQRGERSNYSGENYQEEQTSDSKASNYGNQKPEWRSNDYLEKFQEALDNSAKEAGQEAAEFRQKVAEDFRNGKDLLQYPKEERLDHMKQYVESFNNMEHESFKDRARAANDITQNAFKNLYDDFEAVEANNAEKIPKDVRSALEKEGITAYKFNDETGEIEFEFKDLDQLKRIAKKTGRQVHVLRTDAEQDSGENSGKENYSSKADDKEEEEEQKKKEKQLAEHSGTAWFGAGNDSENDAQRRKEIERAMGKFKETLLFSDKHPDRSAIQMNEALEKGAQYIDMPKEEMQEANNYKNIETLEREELEHKVAEIVQDNWDKVHEAIDRSAASHPEEAESLRIASDALQAAYAESLLASQFEPGTNERNASEHNYNLNRQHMEDYAQELAEAIEGGEPLTEVKAMAYNGQYEVESQVEFTDQAPFTVEEFQAIQESAQAYINEQRQDSHQPGFHYDPKGEAAYQLIEDLKAGIEHINQMEPAIQSGEQYDDGTLNAVYEDASQKARAIQHMMGVRKEQEQESQEEEKEAVAA